MRAGISAILLSVTQPIAIIVGLPFWLIYKWKLRSMLDYEEPAEASDYGWPASPEPDHRTFHPQKKR